MSGARELILGRVRAALADHPEPVRIPPRAPAPPLAPADLADRFAARVREYGATVTLCSGDDTAVASCVAAALDRHGARRVAIAAGLPVGWRPDGAVVDDPPLSIAALRSIDAAVTGAALGIASSGTLVLDGGARSGRRALSLVPDVHVCVVARSALAGDLHAALAGVAARAAAGAPLTLVSGPSATSDIELERVNGVHGPRQLEIVLADDLSYKQRGDRLAR